MEFTSPAGRQAAELLTRAFPNLSHPGDGKLVALPLATFRQDTIPPEMAAQFAADADLPSPDIARLTAEAAIAHLEGNGLSIIATAELDTITQIATDKSGHQQPRVHCRCGKFLYSADINTDRPVINGPQFIRAISSLKPDCPHT